jgi:hypothetical protein
VLKTWDDYEETVALNGDSELLAFLSALVKDMAAISLLYPENSIPAFFERRLEKNLNAYPDLDGTMGITIKEISPFVLAVTDTIIHDVNFEHTADVIEEILEKKEKTIFPDAEAWDDAFNALPDPWDRQHPMHRCRFIPPWHCDKKDEE